MIAAATVLLTSLSITAEPEEEAVLRVMDAFFEALERADIAAMETMVAADATLISLRPGEGHVPQTRRSDRDTFTAGLVGLEGVIVELYWDAKIQISPVGLAQAWIPYVVEARGERVHCGIDHFTFVRRDTGWVITSLYDTRDPSSCGRLGLDEAYDRMRPVSLRAKLKN